MAMQQGEGERGRLGQLSGWDGFHRLWGEQKVGSGSAEKEQVHQESGLPAKVVSACWVSAEAGSW